MQTVKGNFNPGEEDSRIWWDQLREGDKKGLALIYTAYVEEMYQYGMAIKPNRSFVKDCIQEVFVSLWKYKFNLKDTDNVKQYLFRSLSNKIRRDISLDLARYHSEDVGEFVYLFTVDSFELEWIKKQGNEYTRRKLSSAMARLPLRQKEVIHLLFFENAPYEEISSIMELNVKSVYTLAWKAIRNLRKSMLLVVLIPIWSIF